MRGSKDKLRYQFTIERPEKELDARRIHGVRVHLFAWLEHAGEWCPKKVAIVRFQTPPDANIVREVFDKLDHNMCEGLALSAGEMERLIHQRTLGFGEEPGEVLGKFRQGAFAASKPSLGSMSTKIHGGLSPLAPMP